MMTSREGVTLYERVASALRQRVASGELRPGDALPSEDELRAEFGVSRYTLRVALDRLAGEGLIIRQSGKRTRVSEQAEGAQVVTVAAGTRIRARLLMAGERETGGGPVLIVERPGQPAELYPADRTVIITGG